MKIAITGTPGTGKTAIAEFLAKELNKKIKNYKLLDLNHFARENNCVVGYDKKRNSEIIDEEKLAKEVAKLKGSYVIEGHLAGFCKTDILVVLRCSIKELRKRLSKKGWNEDKIQENVDAEIMGIILEDAKQHNKNIIEIDSSGSIKETAALILAKIAGSSSL